MGSPTESPSGTARVHGRHLSKGGRTTGRGWTNHHIGSRYIGAGMFGCQAEDLQQVNHHCGQRTVFRHGVRGIGKESNHHQSDRCYEGPGHR
eukprot:554700-Pyramimonas_sp.AAC.1